MLFRHLDLGVTAGVSGFGLDLESPLNQHLKLRAGISYMPDVQKRGVFDVVVGKKKEPASWDKEGNRTDKLGKLMQMMSQFTGYEVDDHVDAELHGNFYNMKLILDWHPFRRQDWHFSAGFYLGGSQIGWAKNYTEEMPTLLAVGMYNMMYKKAMNDDTSLLGFIDVSPDMLDMLKDKFGSYGPMGMNLGKYKHDHITPVCGDKPYEVYDEDWEEWNLLGYYNEQGEVVPINDYPVTDEEGNLIGFYEVDGVGYPKKAGEIYKMVPDVDGVVRAKAKVNRFKPYVGFGYGCQVGKTKRTTISFDCGVLFWGGVPDIIAHDGVNLTHDIDLVDGNVKDYCDVIQKFPVLPMFELRISHRLF